VYAIDLLGYGYSDKPDPRGQAPNSLYTFETWGQQVLDFCDEIVNDSAFLICNSVGGIYIHNSQILIGYINSYLVYCDSRSHNKSFRLVCVGSLVSK
jgi:pimeloyl-ACP methyl ester carboxylesterase